MLCGPISLPNVASIEDLPRGEVLFKNLFRATRAFSVAATVFLTTSNTAFASDPILPIHVEIGSAVQLDPTDSIEWSAGQNLRAEWVWISRPATSVADFSDPTALRPSFTPDVSGTWEAELQLFDATDPAATTPLSIHALTLSTGNLPPVAHIQARGLPDGVSPLTLDGTRSLDVGGDALTYSWSIESAPVGHGAVFTDSSAPITDFSYDVAGAYTVGLTVQDAQGLVSEVATFDIDIAGAGGDLDLEATLETFNLVTRTFFGQQEVEGRTYIGTTLQNTNGQFGFAPAQDGAAFDELYVDGDLQNSNINLTPGDVAKISGTRINSNVNNGTLVENAADVPAFDFQVFRDQSAFLASLSGEPADLSDQNNKRFGGSPNAIASEAQFGPNTRIVEASLQELQSGGYSIDLSSADTVIINVSGTSGNFQMNPLGGTGFAENVIWNFFEATNINVNSVIVGHILAPYARMTGFAGSSEGTVIADDVQLTNGELHQRDWLGTVPASLGGAGGARTLAPVADLTFDQLATEVNTPLTIDAFASTDLDGDRLTRTPGIIAGPAGATATLTTDAGGAATFLTDTPGEYLVGYEVSDGFNTATDQILISVNGGNLRPVARIAETTGATGVEATLDGTQSYDLDGDLLSYEWSLLHAPSGSTAVLGNTDNPSASLTPDLAGLYIVQLNVDDGVATGVPTTLALNVDAPLPIANAGPDMLPDGAGQAVLDGGLSNGDTLAFLWTPAGAVNGSSLDDASLVMPTLTLPPLSGELRTIVRNEVAYEIRRSDLGGLCAYDTRLPSDIPNPAFTYWHGIAFWANGKVTVDGTDRPIWVIDNQREITRELTLEASDGTNFGTYTLPGLTRAYLSTDPLANGAQMRVFLEGNQVGQAGAQSWTFNRTDEVCSGAGTELVQLIVSDANGISLPDTAFVGDVNLRPTLVRAADISLQGGETANLSATALGFDANGDALTYQWSLIHRPDGSAATIDTDPAVVKVTGEATNFTADRPGLYLVQLEATDGDVIAEPVVLAVTVTGSPPVASALTPADTFVGDVATLDGSASSDPDGDALTFNWTILAAPAGSTATIPDPSGPIATFTPDLRGSYTFQLEVADASQSDTTQVTLTVPNRAPLASLDGLTSISPGSEIVYSALNSSDADGDALTYSFAVTASPSGSAFTLVDLDPGQAGFVADLAGDYTLEASVSDGEDTSVASLTIAAQQQNRAPVLGQIQETYTVELGLEFALDLTATDPDGDEVTFFATPLPLASGIGLDGASGEVRFRPEAGQEGTYVFTVGASDGSLTDEALLTVEVVPGTASDTSVFGRVLDAVDFANGIETPLAGMPVRLRDAALMDITDANGAFDFGSLAAGRDQVLVEPSSNGGPGGYIGTLRNITITENQNRDLAPDFLLTPLNDGCAQVVAGAETVLSGTTSGVTVRIAADTIQNSDGSAYTGEVCLGALPQLFDHPGLPDGTQACNIYAVEAPGATFTTGATLTAPNVDQLPNGTRLLLNQTSAISGLFRPSSNAFVDPGAVTVSATAGAFDEATVFTFLPQAPTSVASADQPTGNRMLNVFEGDLNEVYTLPGYRAFNQTQQVGLSYHSQAANPTIIVAGDVTIADDASLPVTLSTSLDIGGLSIVDSNAWTPRQGANGDTPALVGEELTLRQSMPLDASGLESGRYGYDFRSEAAYACSTVASQHNAELYVQNEADSPYGRGWSIDGLQKLNVSPDGKVSIIDDDMVVTFDPEPTLTEFEEDPLVFPAIGPQDLIIEDFDGNGRLDVAVAETGPGDIFVIENFGSRDFSIGSRVNVETGRDVPQTGTFFPNLLAMGGGDFNNDGIVDLAHSAQFSDRVAYVLNDGFGNFDPVSLATFGNLRDLVVADLDEDGFVDVTVGRFSGFFGIGNGEIHTFWGGPNGFNSTRIGVFAFGRNPLEIRAVDIDGDGRLDVAHRTDRGVNFSFNNGNRSFSSARTQLGGTTQNFLGEYMRFSDLDGDGRKEMIYSTTSQLRVFPNTSGRGFGAATALARPAEVSSFGAIEMVDANADGNEDILFSSGSSVFVYLGNGDGTFLPFEDGFLDRGTSLTKVADLDGDGSLDLITAQRFTVTIFFSKPGGSGRYIAGAGEFSELNRLPDGTWERRYKNGMIAVFDANGLQTAEVDTQGNRIEYAYGADDRLVSKTDQVGGVTSFAYDALGRLATITYPDGRETAFEYDDQENLNEITEPTGSKVSFEYNDEGQLVSTTNQNGNSTLYSYDATGNMSGATYPDGSNINNQVAASLGLVDGLGGPAAQPVVYVEPEDRVTTVTDRKGEVTTVEVNAFGSVIKTTDPLGRVTEMTRDADNLVREVRRPSDVIPGGVRLDTIDYDDLANVTRMTEAAGTAQERITTYTYEPVFNQVTRMTDPDGFTMSYEYDEFGEVTKMIDGENGERLTSYTPEGQLLSRTDENGNETTFTYDANLNLGRITYADGSVTGMTYDASGNATSIAEAEGTPIERQIQRTYDALNRVLTVEVTGADGAQIDGITAYTYEPNGNLSTVTDETGLVTSMSYDALERLTAVDDPAEGLITRIYNQAGEVTQHTNGDGETHIYAYDDVSRLTQTTDPEGFVKSFAYDTRDHIVTVTDGRGGTTSFGYDPLDRMTTRTNPINQIMTRAYDGRDNLTTLTREDGATETATYDGLSRRTQVVTPDNTLTYAYDARSNLTEAADDDSRVTFTYDNRNRLETTTTDGTVGPQPEVTLTYTYDALDRRTSMSDSLGGTTTYAWDPEDRLTDLTAPWGTVYSFGYDGEGRRTSLTSTSGRNSTYGYTNGLLTALSHVQSGVALTDLNYTYDVDSQLTAIVDNLDPNKSKAISYDQLNRLVQVAEGVPTSLGGTPIPVEDYAYDQEGNRTASHLSALYSSNDHNQLLEDDTYTYGYDLKGNRVSRTEKATGDVETYTYDSENRLVGYASPTTTASYAYDAVERRISKTVLSSDTGSDGETSTYVYDTRDLGDPTGSDIAIEERSGKLRRWLFGPGTDEPLAFEEYENGAVPNSGQLFELFANRIGSVVTAVSLATGAIAAEYDYDAFGKRTSSVDQIEQQYGFTGREHDDESDLIHARMRSNDPRTGQFIQTDPLGLAGDGPNTYTYALNDPFGRTDPSGLVSTSTYYSPNATDARRQMQGSVTTNVSSGLFSAGFNIAQVLAGISLGNPVEIMGHAPPNGGGSSNCNANSNQQGQHVYMIYQRMTGGNTGNNGSTNRKVLKFGVSNNKNLYKRGPIYRSKRADKQVDYVTTQYAVILLVPAGYYSRQLAYQIEQILVNVYDTDPKWQKRPTRKC